MSYMAGVILGTLVLGALSRRTRAPNSESQEALRREVGPSVDAGHAHVQANRLHLHMSTLSNTGYLGVTYMCPGRFMARYKGKYLGNFATDVEAAEVYAAAACGLLTPVAGTEVEGPRLTQRARSKYGFLGVTTNTAVRVKKHYRAHYKRKYLGSFATAVEAAQAVAKAKADPDHGTDVSLADIEVEGLILRRSASKSSFLGVSIDARSPNNQFYVRYKQKYLGHFATAVEAAVAYARADAEAHPGRLPQGHQENFPDVLDGAGPSTGLASTSQDAVDGSDRDSTHPAYASEDEPENSSIHTSPSQEVSRRSEHGLWRLREAARAARAANATDNEDI